MIKQHTYELVIIYNIYSIIYICTYTYISMTEISFLDIVFALITFLFHSQNQVQFLLKFCMDNSTYCI